MGSPGLSGQGLRCCGGQTRLEPGGASLPQGIRIHWPQGHLQATFEAPTGRPAQGGPRRDPLAEQGRHLRCSFDRPLAGPGRGLLLPSGPLPFGLRPGHRGPSYSDDGWLTGRRKDSEFPLVLFMFYPAVIDAPLSWHKMTGGIESERVGTSSMSVASASASPKPEPNGPSAGSTTRSASAESTSASSAKDWADCSSWRDRLNKSDPSSDLSTPGPAPAPATPAFAPRQDLLPPVHRDRAEARAHGAKPFESPSSR